MKRLLKGLLEGEQKNIVRDNDVVKNHHPMCVYQLYEKSRIHVAWGQSRPDQCFRIRISNAYQIENIIRKQA
jgi:hypothetical protein